MPRKRKLTTTDKARQQADLKNQLAEQKRGTKIPIAKIRKLIKLDKQLKDQIREIMETHSVSIGYIRGLLKTPMGK